MMHIVTQSEIDNEITDLSIVTENCGRKGVQAGAWRSL
jgi:hypothetical protein